MKAAIKTLSSRDGDMRTRYVPGVRIQHGFLSMLPWIDLSLIVLYLVLLHTRIVLQPGVVVELPAGHSAPGLYSPLIAVVVATGTARSPEVKVFFDNEQYVLSNAKRMEAFRAALVAKRQLQRGEAALTLYAGQRVENRYLMQMIQMAQESGMQRINLGTQPAVTPP